ncbi:MAG: tetratricopeptide repeat protein [Magnetococcales bacterium]|nr:tetratricopeptide repeat protein [Magnetococcales bacterium]
MADNPWVVNVDEAGFEAQVLRRSLDTPVLVDFWASWCGPCRMLGPVLEKLAREGNGRFVLAKVDSDRNKQLARQWGVKGIPAVKLFVDGQLKDEFTGALPETAIRQFLERAIPSPADQRVEFARRLLLDGRTDQAQAVCEETLTLDSRHGPTLLLLTQLALDRGDVEGGKGYFARLDATTAIGPEAVRLKARLAFAGGQGDLTRWQQQVASDPTDLQARLQYGQGLIGVERYAEGMDQFLEILRKDRQFQDDAARKAMINTFDMLGPEHPLVSSYRSKMSAVLFS